MTAANDVQDEQPQEEREVRLDPAQQAEWGDVSIAGHEKPVDETEEEVVEDEEEQEEIVEEHDIPAPLVTVEDPGQYTPADYSFEITLNGKTTNITSVDQAEKFADEHAEEFTAKDLLAFTRKTNRMESNLERDKEEFERKQASYKEQKQAEDERQEAINNIANEITYLVSKGKLPKVSAQYATADWSDPDVAKQNGVKEQIELLDYMRKENDARIKSGLKPLTSAVDAYNALQLEKRDNEVVDVDKQRAAARKRAGGRVAGNSPNPVNIAPKGISVGRTLSLSELDSF